MGWIKTSKALSSKQDAFRIEKKMVYDELNYDIIWQGNGEDEEIAMLVDKEDLIKLGKVINKLI